MTIGQEALKRHPGDSRNDKVNESLGFRPRSAAATKALEDNRDEVGCFIALVALLIPLP